MDPSKLSPAILDTYPAMTPPKGYETNFANPGVDGSNANSTVIVTAFLTSLTVLILLLRLYTKKFVLRRFGWDDYTAIAATTGAIAYAGLIIYVFSHGFGVHEWNYLNAITYIYKPFMLMAKISLCIFFLNLFGTKPRMRWAIYLAIAYNAILQTVGFFLAIFLCIPGRPEFWQCSNKVSILNVATSGFNIFIDFYLLFLPLFAISQLQMRSRRKVGILLIFLVGTLACVASILGLIFRLKQNASKDVSWNFAPEIILVTFELEATIMVGCFLVFPALFNSKHPLSFRSLWSNCSQLLKGRSSASSNSSRSQNEKVLGDEEDLNKRTFDSHKISMNSSGTFRPNA